MAHNHTCQAAARQNCHLITAVQRRSLILATTALILVAWSALHAADAASDITIPEPDPKAAEVPSGFRVQVAVDRLMYPSSIEFDDRGGMYIAECGYMPGDDSQSARILRLDRSHSPVRRQVLVDNLSAPITDLLWHRGRLFISHKGKISVWENEDVHDLVTDLPSFGDHSNNQLAIGPDGKLYFGQGSATNSGVVGEDNFAFGWPNEHPDVHETTAQDIILTDQTFESADPRSKNKSAKVKTSAFQPFGETQPEGTVVKGRTKANSTILRIDLDGSNLEVYAWGFRNPYGVLWSSDKRLYVADAGSDERGSRHIKDAPEKLWVVDQDAWYGWPDYVAGIPVTDPQFQPANGPALQFLMKEHPPAEKPLLTFETHSSVTQMDESRNARFGFVGEIFVASSGDQSPVTAAEEVRAGYWLQRVDPESKRATMFFRSRPDALGPKGLEYVTTAGPKRLVDVRFHGDSLYVVDIGPIHYVRGDKGPEPKAFPKTGVVWAD